MDAVSVFIDINKWIIDINNSFIDINKYGLNVKTAANTVQIAIGEHWTITSCAEFDPSTSRDSGTCNRRRWIRRWRQLERGD